MPYYLNPNNVGISSVAARGDGNIITLKWHRAFASHPGGLIAYNIYMDTVLPNFEIELFNRSPMFVSVDGKLTVDIIDLTPGQMYRFGVRPVEYSLDTSYDLKLLPTTFNNLRVYPETILREDITATSTIIPVLNVDTFPAAGVLKVGAELIQYNSIDTINNNFILTNPALQRGFNDTEATFHNLDGYDGYQTWETPFVLFWPVDTEDQNTVVFATQDRFDDGYYAFTLVDGYRQTTHDIVNADLTVSDVASADFPPFDFSGYRRIDPIDLFNGACVGSYFGGQIGCADGYNGVGSQVRGISVNDRNAQRQELMLELIGEPVCLIKRQFTNIRCYCVTATQEQPDARCLKCYGGGYVVSYNQYFSTRRNDGKILMKFDPWVDSLPLVESGLTVQDVRPSAWTLVLPAIKPRDFIVRFDADGNEEFRYEVLSSTRNILFNQQFGAQKLALQRIRKTDIIYQCKVFRDTSQFPITLSTSVDSSLGIPPHSHTFVTNEKHPMYWQQLTGNAASHNHVISWNANTGFLEVSTELGHTHTLIY